MNMKDTVDMMLSEDYRERFRAEYHQTKIRYEKLHKMIVKYEAGVLIFEPTCSLELLKQQKAAMGQYLYYLEMRAELEHIDLEAPLDEDKPCQDQSSCGDTENHCEEDTCNESEPQCKNPYCLNFSAALESMKNGRKACRYGWRGFVLLVDDLEFHTDANLEAFEDMPVDVRPMIVQWEGLTVKPGWAPSQEDILAEDWTVFD